MNILGLDISTSCTGWCVFSDDKKILESGHIDMPTGPKKFQNPFQKLTFARNEIGKIIDKYDISTVYVEEALKKFSGGGSSAHTMNLLIAFNFSLCYFIWEKTGKEPIGVNVNSARTKAGIKFPKGIKKENKKEFIRQRNETKYPHLIWEKKKTGRYKDFCYDVSDAIIIGEYYFNG